VLVKVAPALTLTRFAVLTQTQKTGFFSDEGSIFRPMLEVFGALLRDNLPEGSSLRSRALPFVGESKPFMIGCENPGFGNP